MTMPIKQLRFKNVSLNIGGKKVCDSLNVTLKAGEVWGLLGPNGCGKSTLLHAIAKLHPLAAGEMLYAPHALPLKLAKHIGLLFQEINTAFSQNVRQYCAASRYPHLSFLQQYTHKDEEIINSALMLTDLQHLQYHSILSLSGGEKRRAAIAALLIQTPDIYLLDEPANHLDLYHQTKLLGHFKHLAKQTEVIVLMALHDINHAEQYCDHMILMFPNGETLSGPKEEMLTAENLSRLYQQRLKRIDWQKEIFWKAAVGVS